LPFEFAMSLLGEGGLPSQPYIYVVGRAGVEKTADIVILRFDLVANQNEDRLCVCGIADVLPEIQGKISPAENERTIVTASEIPTKGERVPSEYRSHR
jgi:hypothetical protein